MKEYEVMYILRPCSNDKVQEVVAKVADTITRNGGVVLKSDVWGEKRLAYTIKNCVRGIYVLDTFMMDGRRIKELVKALNISEIVLHYMIISKL